MMIFPAQGKITQFLPYRPALFIFILFVAASCTGVHRSRSPEGKVSEVIKNARTFTGTPYKWGGVTRAGLDCSGLICNAFKSANITLPRTADAQALLGEKIKIGDVQPGDLLFFATGRKKNVITHVGIVTEIKAKDNVKFIHSSSSLGVVETNLYSDYFFKRFRIARRIILE